MRPPVLQLRQDAPRAPRLRPRHARGWPPPRAHASRRHRLWLPRQELAQDATEESGRALATKGAQARMAYGPRCRAALGRDEEADERRDAAAVAGVREQGEQEGIDLACDLNWRTSDCLLVRLTGHGLGHGPRADAIASSSGTVAHDRSVSTDSLTWSRVLPERAAFREGRV